MLEGGEDKKMSEAEEKNNTVKFCSTICEVVESFAGFVETTSKSP